MFRTFNFQLQQDDKFVDLYPAQIIDDNGIFGSCMTYKTRKKVTEEIRNDDSALLSLTEAFEK